MAVMYPKVKNKLALFLVTNIRKIRSANCCTFNAYTHIHFLTLNGLHVPKKGLINVVCIKGI